MEPAGVMDQEEEYLAILGRISGYAVTDGELTFNSDDGRILRFVRE
jgi:hypothetical protein